MKSKFWVAVIELVGNLERDARKGMKSEQSHLQAM